MGSEVYHDRRAIPVRNIEDFIAIAQFGIKSTIPNRSHPVAPRACGWVEFDRTWITGIASLVRWYTLIARVAGAGGDLRNNWRKTMGTENFANPPIVELVLGVQFAPLAKMTAGHFGLFWKELGIDWVDPSDGPMIEDQFELFDRPKRISDRDLLFRFEPLRFPGRFLIGHKDQDRLIQMQATRFHLNWRKRLGGVYLSYNSLIAEFEETFAKFKAFTEKAGLGTVAANQWELTYIDAFPIGEYWRTPADWSKVLPGLFSGLFSTEDIGTELEHRAAEWGYEIKPKMGRLHIVAQRGRANDDPREALLLQMTARGPVQSGVKDALRSGFDLGHDAAKKTFLRVTSEEAKMKWSQV